MSSFQVRSPNVVYGEDSIESKYNYRSTLVNGSDVSVVDNEMTFKTDTRVPKMGLMLVGWGGNNGSTVTAGLLANKHGLKWETKEGMKSANFLGSLTQASTVRLGLNAKGESVYIPFNSILPMVRPEDAVIGGWDISSLNLADAVRRARVLDIDLQRKVCPLMKHMKPLPSIYYPDFIAANQSDRADNVLGGNKAEQLEVIRQNIRDFKADNELDKVIVLWTANTERFCDIVPGLNDTAAALLASIEVRCLINDFALRK
jgi:myo-inositol-1-phosphate synthase